MNKYPYYIIPDIEHLPDASGEERLKLIRRIATAIGDPVALRAIIGIDPREFLDFYPDMSAPELTTAETIDSFLDRFAPASMKNSHANDELIVVPAVPYDLSQLEDLPELDADPLFPAGFMQPEPAPAAEKNTVQPKTAEEPQNTPEQTSLSESLAKIMIKNGNYHKALEIITEISLNNPKKSVYFADQIRFLKKLIKYTSVSK